MQNENNIEKEQVANEVQETKTFSANEIKKRLKARSKSELINIIINLSSKIDELKESVKDGKE
jgi:hypothetical protein